MVTRPLYYLTFAVVMTAIAVGSALAMLLYVPVFVLQTCVQLATGKVGRRRRSVSVDVGVGLELPRPLPEPRTRSRSRKAV